MGAVANGTPAMVVARMIGVPDDDAETLFGGCSATQLLEGLVTADHMSPPPRRDGTEWIHQRAVPACGRGPDGGLIGDLARACARGDIDPTAAHVMIVTPVQRRRESTSSLIGSAAWVLARNDARIQKRVREDPGSFGAFLEEVLRYEPPFRGHYRHVVTDTELCGVALPEGSRLLLLWGPPTVIRPISGILMSSDWTGQPARATSLSVGDALLRRRRSLARLEATIVLGELLGRTAGIATDDSARWQPSLLVRRLDGYPSSSSDDFGVAGCALWIGLRRQGCLRCEPGCVGVRIRTGRQVQ